MTHKLGCDCILKSTGINYSHSVSHTGSSIQGACTACKIVQLFPDLYDHMLDKYRNRRRLLIGILLIINSTIRFIYRDTIVDKNKYASWDAFVNSPI